MKRFVSYQAFSLVEVTIAMGIAAYCLLAIFGLLPVGMNSNQTSVNTTRAAGLAQTIVTDLRNTEHQGTSTIYKLNPDTATTNSKIYLKEDGTMVGSADLADYCATVTIGPSPAAGDYAPTTVRITISWPAVVARPLNVFEVTTALDRS